jgi:hypothetical protein
MHARTKVLGSAAVLAGAAFLASGLALGGDDPEPGRSEQKGEAKEPSMAEMMAMALPGEEHRFLAKTAGEFDQELTVQWQPEVEAVTSKGTCTNEMILGGRFLLARWKATFMGMPMEGLSVTGFDRRKGVFTNTGYDTGGTYSVFAEGPRDPETGIITLHGVDESPLGREAWTMDMNVESADRYTLTLRFSEQGGRVFDPPFQVLEIVSTRKKP